MPKKYTIAPIREVHHDFSYDAEFAPITLIPSMQFREITSLFPADTFALWSEYLNYDERSELKSLRYALIHEFEGPEVIGLEDQNSKDEVYRAFVCLRLIKPTKERYRAIQFKQSDRTPDVYSIDHPPRLPLNMPSAEVINVIERSDLMKTRQILPAFMKVAAEPKRRPEMRRALRLYEAAYSDVRDSSLQILMWCMGIEAVVSGDRRIKRRTDLIARISDVIDVDEEIYAGSPLSEFISMPSFTPRYALWDLFALRNRLVHGGDAEVSWRRPLSRPTLQGPTLGYQEMLREAAAFVLRKCILAKLSTMGASPTDSK